MARLLLFNPEHDYALAHGGAYYAAPASITRLAQKLELLPAIWGEKDDLILKSNNEICRTADLSHSLSPGEIIDEIEEIVPWGWNEALRNRLLPLGISEDKIPGKDIIENLRRLSHRRISISCNRFLQSPAIPKEFSNVEDAMEFSRSHSSCYFKMPWSSGGRGVLATKELNDIQIKEWVGGAIRKQGSVLAEFLIEKEIEIASLWNIKKGIVGFDGFSISLVDGRGKYKGNFYGLQSRMAAYISEFTEERDKYLVRQKEFLSKEVAPKYEGKVGIDMIIDRQGKLYPCVEINLRRTMGHVALDFEKLNPSVKSQLAGLDLPLIPFASN